MIAYIMSRKYVEELMSIPEKEGPNATNINTGLEYCNKLFSIERKLKEFDYKKIFKRRTEEAKPIVSAYFEWLKSMEDKVVSKSFLGIAVKYSLNKQKKKLLLSLLFLIQVKRRTI